MAARGGVGPGVSGRALALLALPCLACAAAPATEPPLAAPARPLPCADVLAGADLQRVVDTAAAGSALCLSPGDYRGPLRIQRTVTLWGPPAARIRSGGEGTTVSVAAPGTRLLGFTVDGSGGRYDTLDAAVRVAADGVVVEGLAIVHAVFGVLVEQANRVELRGNDVTGTGGDALGLRGDGIRLWETRDSVVEGNRVRDSRDVVVWYSPRNRISGNTVHGGRYGTHLMYSHENVVEGNRFVGNVVGLFVMYSRDIDVRDNLLAGAAGAAGVGIGLKESGNVRVTGNLVLRDTVGIYIDTSPLQRDEHNVFERNIVRLSQTGVVFHGSEERNEFRGNSFRDNRTQVVVEGGSDPGGIAWRGNDFDDYRGFDLDGDATGDVPYELRSLSGQLVGHTPELAFFEGCAALVLVDALSHAMPLFAPKTLLVDPAPRMEALALEDLRGD